jgi:hypothetical protein
VSSVVDTEIECVTGPHRGSINTKVDVEVSGNGIAGEVCLCILFVNLLFVNLYSLFYSSEDIASVMLQGQKTFVCRGLI